MIFIRIFFRRVLKLQLYCCTFDKCTSYNFLIENVADFFFYMEVLRLGERPACFNDWDLLSKKQGKKFTTKEACVTS